MEEANACSDFWFILVSLSINCDCIYALSLKCISILIPDCYCRFRFISQLPLHAVGAGVLCDNIPGLAGRQRRLCRMHPGVMVSLGEGAKMGIKECQSQFRFHRWNCSTLDRDASVFGKVMLKGRVNERMQQSDKHWRHFKVRNIFISYMITCDNYPVIILDYTLQLWICEFKLYQYNALINPFIYKLYIFITKSICTCIWESFWSSLLRVLHISFFRIQRK